MNIDQIFSQYLNISPWFIIKIIILIFLLFYIFFAMVLKRQITLMNRVLEAKFSPVIKLIGIAHLFLVLAIFLLALIIL